MNNTGKFITGQEQIYRPTVEELRTAKLSKSNVTGFKGVSWKKRERKYEAYLYLNYKKICLGLFETITKAVQARAVGELKYWS